MGGGRKTLKPATVPIRQRSGCAVDYVGYNYGLICCVSVMMNMGYFMTIGRDQNVTYVKFSVVYKYVLSNIMPVLDNL